jgi:AcrR family transcriptional regulator
MELVLAALVVIARQGFDRTTVRDIADEAGAAVGSVHYYFKTKEELLYAAFEESERRTFARLDEIDQTTGSALERLRKVFALCLPSDDAEDPQWNLEIDVWQQAARYKTFRELFAHANRGWASRIRSILEAGVRDRELNVSDTEAEAISLAAMIDGLGIYARVTQHLDAATARDLLERRLRELSG